MASHKLNIFEVLSKIDANDLDFFSAMSEDDLKSVQPLVLMRWLTGTTDAKQIFLLNEIVNPLVFSMSNHKLLLVSLLSICSSNTQRRYKWTKVQGKNTSAMPKVVDVIQEYFGYSKTEAVEVIPLLTDANIIDYAAQLGRQSTEVSAIKRELKKRKK